MKERPILFSGEMVRAILEGRKTQTRRAVKPMPTYHYDHWQFKGANFHTDGMREWLNTPYPNGEKCPYGAAGDRLWARETWAVSPFLNKYAPSKIPSETPVVYRADKINESHFLFRPSIFMPRWASRLTLEIVAVRVERLNEISDNDAEDEGVTLSENSIYLGGSGHRLEFSRLWNRINEKRGFGWDKNPFVWVIEFKRLT